MTYKYHRIFTIVLDSLGAGAMPDAASYHDEGSDTLGHIVQRMPAIQIPNLVKIGLGNLHPLPPDKRVAQPIGYYTKLLEASKGKDTMSGHWEMMGLQVKEPFLTFTSHGFPKALLDELSERTTHHIIGNKAASGTEILKELGAQSDKTNDLIVYTSADSVLQICGNEEQMGLKELYRCCEIARELTMKPEWKVGRVIARPYVKEQDGSYIRTSNRRDYALKPFHATLLNLLQEHAFDVIGIGKIHDIFHGEGITQVLHSDSSVHGMQQTLDTLQQAFCGLCYVNLVDFDALWGHRRDPIGYGKELEHFDRLLGDVLSAMKPDDLLILTADHGNDPTYIGSDHTREMVPFLAYSPSMKGHGLMPISSSFAMIGATIAENFQIELPATWIGKSYFQYLQ